MQCDKSLSDGFEGLKANDQFLSFADINPEIGLVTDYRLTAQINADMRKIDGVKVAKGLRDTVFPLAYLIDEPNGDLYNSEDIKRFKRIIEKRR